MFKLINLLTLKYLSRLMVFATLFIGLYGSLLVTFYTFQVEPDFSDTAMLWFGYKQHGWHFFSSWLYTTDNWLLSLAPLHFLLFGLFGAKPLIVLITGWAIFIASLFISALILKSLQALKAAVFLPLTLLFAGHFAHATGFLTYSISHNITNLYGLICVLMAVYWLHHKKRGLLVSLFAAALIGGVSDPWMLGAYLYPLLFASFLFLLLHRRTLLKRSFLLLFLTLLLAVIGSKSRCFELLHFLPLYRYQSARPDLLQNFTGLINNIGRLIPIFAWPLFSFVIFISLFIYSLFSIYKNRQTENNISLHYFFTLAVLSIAAISLALLLDNSAADKSRFLLNIFYLGPIAIAIAIEKQASKFFKSLAVMAAIFFMFTGLISNLNAWKKHTPHLQDEKIRKFISFLEQHQLYYGYGPYWGSSANAVTWLSDHKIQLIPVKFSKDTGKIITGKRYQTSTYWQLPTRQQSFFVFIQNDDEECPNISLCMKGVKQQFGAPHKILTYQDGLVFVWN